MTLSKRDFPQILKAVFNETEQALSVTGTLVPGGAAIPVDVINSLIPTAYDTIDLTYVPSGNGVGQIQTATYSYLGTTVGTLTLLYDANNNLIKVAKT